MPKVSIITASYNYDEYIKETIESVINQTFQDWEMIIVDDGSKDSSIDVIESYCQKDNRIKLFQHENGKNKGFVETIKLGISKANSEWIVFLESDDKIVPDYIEEKLKIIQEYPEIKFIFNDVNPFGNNKVIKEIDRYFINQKNTLKKYVFPANLHKEFINSNIVPTFSCVMLKKELFSDVDFNTPCNPIPDWHIWMQISKKCDFYYIDKKLTYWRMHNKSYINKISAIEIYKFELLKNNFYNIKQSKFKKFLNFLKAIRRCIIRIHFKSKKIYLFGHLYVFDRE